MARPVQWIFAGMLMSGTTAVMARSEQCHPVSETTIASLFDRWNGSLQTGDAKKVVETNYAPQSVLLPTLSNTARLTPEAKEDYFRDFLPKRPVGKVDTRIIEVECNVALDSGIYTFSFNDGSRVQARYTFAYKWDGKDWKIVAHHSSAMPEKAGIATPSASGSAAVVAAPAEKVTRVQETVTVDRTSPMMVGNQTFVTPRKLVSRKTVETAVSAAGASPAVEQSTIEEKAMSWDGKNWKSAGKRMVTVLKKDPSASSTDTADSETADGSSKDSQKKVMSWDGKNWRRVTSRPAQGNSPANAGQ